MGEGNFRPPTASRPLNRFSWNLKYITTSWTRLRMQNFRGLYRHGWSGQIASLTCESFCPFFPFFIMPTGHIYRHITTHKTSLYIIPPRKCLLGVRKITFEISPTLPPKSQTCKNLDFKLMDNENCSRPNSETVSCIQLKLGTGIDHPSGITWHVSRSKGKVTMSRNISR